MKKLILFVIIKSTLLTVNCNAQWLQQTSGITTPLYNIQFVNLNTGWACGNNSEIVKTTDGGLSWFQQTIDLGYPKDLYGLSMLDENTGYIAGWFETILKTTNSGINWNIISNIPSNNGNSNNAVSFFNVNTGWICSFLGRVLKTTNSGLNWDTINIGNTGPLRDIQFLDLQTGWVCGDGGNLKSSTDGGISWITAPILTAANLTSLSFININTGWVVSETGRRIFRTTNAGVKWDTVAVLPGVGTDFLYAVHFVNALTGWTGGSTSHLWKSTDGGFVWIEQILPAPMFISGFTFMNDTTGWACGGNVGRIIHTTNGGTYVGINPVSNETPDDFELYQNYPNPFNPITKIKFDVPLGKGGNRELKVKLIVYDILGREIETLVNEQLKPGTYEINWDGSGFSSGTYFYRISTENYSETKKFILVK